MELKLRLTGYSRAEFEEAKRDQALVGWLQMVTVASSVFAIFIPNAVVTYITSVLAIMGAFAWNSVNARGGRKKATAERARRALMLTGGLGRQLSNKEIADILGEFTVSEEKAQKWVDNEYFAVSDPPGPVRFARMMQQSAFWSKELYRRSAQASWAQVTISAILTIGPLLALPLFPGTKFLTEIVQMVCVGLNLFVTRDLIGKALCYGEASHSLGLLDEKLEGVVAANPSEADVLAVFGDYNSVVECTPLISQGIYDKHNPVLERLWAERTQNKGTDTGN